MPALHRHPGVHILAALFHRHLHDAVKGIAGIGDSALAA